MNITEKTKIQLGYIPLLDCIALLWAKERGYFDEMGLDVTLVKEASWASLRDRLAFGILDAAHCLSAMLPAACTAEDQIGIPLKTPLVLSMNRAYISLSQKLAYSLHINDVQSAKSNAEKVIQYIQAGHEITLAHVFKHSIHHYCLREWLALADQTIAQNLNFKTMPPPYLVEAVSNQLIDGFCVGEPWNTQGEIEGVSQIVAFGQDIIPHVTDKVLAVTQEWAMQHPKTLIKLTAAVLKAQADLKNLNDFSQVWAILVEFNIIRFDCTPERHVQKYYIIEKIIREMVGKTAQPQTQDFLWLFDQMQKWDQVSLDPKHLPHLSDQCIDAQTYKAALAYLNET